MILKVLSLYLFLGLKASLYSPLRCLVPCVVAILSDSPCELSARYSAVLRALENLSIMRSTGSNCKSNATAYQ